MKETLYPIGVQHFPTLIQEGFVYVDKTELIYRMIRTGRAYFLSRPRRFGKSLLISVLESIFRGEKELFKELWIGSSEYHFKSYPVVSLDFSMLNSDTFEDLERTLVDTLQEIAEAHGIGEVRKSSAPETLIKLITELHKLGPVVVLVDEYDKPILDHLEDEERVRKYRSFFKAFFTRLKGLGKFLQFSLITGVTKFSQVSLFSGMNNLEDISFQTPYDRLLGITASELERYFGHVIEEIEKKDTSIRERIRQWYNGYRFSGLSDSLTVYNPLSVFSYLKSRRLSNYWFATGTPAFAFHLIRENNYELLPFEKGIFVGNAIEMNHEVDSIDLVTLLYQTGYLTIKEYDQNRQRYLLGFPNEEVRRSLYEHLLFFFSSLKDFQASQNFSESIPKISE